MNTLTQTKFFVEDFEKIPETANLFIFTKQTLSGKLHFLCSEVFLILAHCAENDRPDNIQYSLVFDNHCIVIGIAATKYITLQKCI